MLYDYSTKETPEMRVLVVRARNTYGQAKAGDHVRVDAKEALNPSTRAACMTLDERAALEDLRAAAEANVTRPGAVKEAVERELARLTAQAEEKSRKSKKSTAAAAPTE